MELPPPSRPKKPPASGASSCPQSPATQSLAAHPCHAPRIRGHSLAWSERLIRDSLGRARCGRSGAAIKPDPVGVLSPRCRPARHSSDDRGCGEYSKSNENENPIPIAENGQAIAPERGDRHV